MQDALAQALTGTSVVALATNIPGPLAAARLASLGADVRKIEPPAGDALAAACRPWYDALCAGMTVERLDLREAAQRERVDALLRDADVLITAMRAAALARAGLDWEALQARHPRLCHVAVVGEAGPHADRAGHDLTYQARAGLLSPPAMPRTVLGDLAAAERAVSASLAALEARRRSGRGVRAEVAIVDAATAFAQPFAYGLTAAQGPLGGALATYRLYPAREGWVAVAALEPHFEQRLRALLGVEVLDAPALQAAFAQRTAVQWEMLAAAADVPLAAVR